VRQKKAPSSLPVGWIAAAIVSVALIWFSLGLFSVWPNVIYSGSMSPAMEVGDVVIILETSPEEINVGDVIAFSREESTVIHRVVDITDTESGRAFITQGDANKSPDSDPVVSGQILGRVIYTVPKVGWAAVGVKNWLFSSG
jgi:signal peptidase